jgi:hypothetical protein
MDNSQVFSKLSLFHNSIDRKQFEVLCFQSKSSLKTAIHKVFSVAYFQGNYSIVRLFRSFKWIAGILMTLCVTRDYRWQIWHCKLKRYFYSPSYLWDGNWEDFDWGHPGQKVYKISSQSIKAGCIVMCLSFQLYARIITGGSYCKLARAEMQVPTWKTAIAKRAGSMGQVVECLPGKGEVLSSTPGWMDGWTDR